MLFQTPDVYIILYYVYCIHKKTQIYFIIFLIVIKDTIQIEQIKFTLHRIAFT